MSDVSAIRAPKLLPQGLRTSRRSCSCLSLKVSISYEPIGRAGTPSSAASGGCTDDGGIRAGEVEPLERPGGGLATRAGLRSDRRSAHANAARPDSAGARDAAMGVFLASLGLGGVRGA